MSWELGTFKKCRFYESNLMPIHISGTVGDNTTPGANQLTLVNVNDPSGNKITQLTLSGATPNDVNAIKSGDRMQFIYNVSGKPNMHFLTYTGHKPTGLPVQFRAIADAGADSSGNVIVNIFPALQSTPGLNQNLNNSLSAGMIVQVVASHRVGAIMSGNPLYTAMPQLPSTEPYPSVRTTDSETGVSIRHYWGMLYGQATKSYVWDDIWGSTLVAENCSALLFPLTASS